MLGVTGIDLLCTHVSSSHYLVVIVDIAMNNEARKGKEEVYKWLFMEKKII